MTPMFLWAFAQLELLEGFESNDAGDPGGHTILGITETYWPTDFAKLKAAKSWTERRCIAKAFYWEHFWKPLNCEEIGNKFVAYELFEFSVNCPAAARDVKDKLCNKLWCASLKEATEAWGALPVVFGFNMYQYRYYLTLRKKRPQFWDGWQARCWDTAEAMLDEMVTRRTTAQNPSNPTT